MKAECTINGKTIRRYEYNGQDEVAIEADPPYSVSEFAMMRVLRETGLFTDFEISSAIGVSTKIGDLANAIKEAVREVNPG